MLFPKELWPEVYLDDRIFQRPFEEKSWSPARPDLETSVFGTLDDIIMRYQLLGLVSLDLGLGLEKARFYFAWSGRAFLRAAKLPMREGLDVMPAFSAFGITGDEKAAREFARDWAKGEVVQKEGESELCENEWSFSLNYVLAGHASGDSHLREKSVDYLKNKKPYKKFGAAGTAWFEAMRELALLCIEEKKPDPFEALTKAAMQNQAYWKTGWEDDVVFERWFAWNLFGFAAIAKQRGWSVPAKDPHPSIPLGLLRLPKMAIPDGEWLRPDEETHMAIARAEKEAGNMC